MADAKGEYIRRRVPGWIRSMSDQSVHGLAGRLHRELVYGEGTDRQGWLFDTVLSELAYRGRRDRRGGIKACACQWCTEPFPEDDEPF